ncbi:MAG: family 16 glycoside hydrolase [Planctomycetaceae bacterium]
MRRSFSRRLRSFAGLASLVLATVLTGCPNSPPPAAPTPPPHDEPAETAPAAPTADSPQSEAAPSSGPNGPILPPSPATNGSAALPAQSSQPVPDTGVAATPTRKLPPLPDPYAVPFVRALDSGRAAEGWISLFDGESLMGWRRHDNGADWQVVDGVITASEGPIDLLCTAVPFANYELEIDFRIATDGNSGVFLRTNDRPGKVETDCYELNIADSQPQGFTTGALVGRQATTQPITGSGGWKTFHVTAEGNHFTVYLDGNLVLDYTDDTDAPRASGLIGLQKNAGKVEFRNIFLKPLEMTPLFNGKDLTGWHVAPGGASEFTAVDGTIQVVNGRGFLETDGEWSNFIFQAESRTNAPELNSGYFFRGPTIVADVNGKKDGNCHGYEAQINNALIDGDRKQPKDFGTGAIYRRVKARYVVPNDEDWFTTTLVADGPQICTWIDGYMTVDWRDDRPVAENGRNGQYTGPGHISLQGHDPTTTLNFRNLRVAELPAPSPRPSAGTNN